MATITMNDSAPQTEQTGAALRRLGLILVVFGAFIALSYFWPLLHGFRPWLPGEKAPLSRLVEMWQEDVSGRTATTIFKWASVTPGGEEATRAAIADALGAAIAANLGGEAGLGERPGRGEPAPAPAPEPSPGAAPPAAPAVVIAADELEGLVRSLELPHPEALDTFWAALAASAAGQPGKITRIAHYGDSTIATDGITATVRQRLQGRFGDAGHGFVLLARGYMPYGHKDVEHSASDDWKLYPILRGQLGDDGWYGYGGVAYRSFGGAKARFGTVAEGPVGRHVSLFELFYQAHPAGGEVALRLDGGEERRLSTRAEETRDAWERIEVPDGPHSLEVRAAGGGQVRLYGVALEREGPGVVYDSLGIVGARARRLLNADPAHWATQIAHRSPDLLILAFGGNEADDKWGTAEHYETGLTEVIRTMRRGKPKMACLLFAPLDQGERDERGGIRTMPTIPKIVASQRVVALREGCAFFDTFSAMGGERAMERWFRTTPRLAWGDFRHATPAGYEVIGNFFYKALLEGLADYLRRTTGAPSPVSPAATPATTDSAP